MPSLILLLTPAIGAVRREASQPSANSRRPSSKPLDVKPIIARTDESRRPLAREQSSEGARSNGGSPVALLRAMPMAPPRGHIAQTPNAQPTRRTLASTMNDHIVGAPVLGRRTTVSRPPAGCSSKARGGRRWRLERARRGTRWRSDSSGPACQERSDQADGGVPPLRRCDGHLGIDRVTQRLALLACGTISRGSPPARRCAGCGPRAVAGVVDRDSGPNPRIVDAVPFGHPPRHRSEDRP